MDGSKPIYNIGDILVLIEHDGRSMDHTFLLVESLTPTKNPRVFVLETEETVIHNDPLYSRTKVKPTQKSIESPESNIQILRWYSSSGEYGFTKPDGLFYTTTEIYDPKKEYFDSWLSQ
jgi:hypothetical protein